MIRATASRHLGVIVVSVAHGAVLAMIWQWQVHAPPVLSDTPLFAQLISPPPPAVAPEPPRPAPVPAPRPEMKRQELPPLQLAAQTDSAIAPAVAAPPAPIQEAPARTLPAPPVTGPITLGGELSVACPERPPPDYPSTSRRIGEQGRTVIRVELDTEGRIADARIDAGSGAERLDKAALAAVKRWRCQPARRDGVAVRAIALQPFDFVLRTQ
jgi:protein TonB